MRNLISITRTVFTAKPGRRARCMRLSLTAALAAWAVLVMMATLLSIDRVQAQDAGTRVALSKERNYSPISRAADGEIRIADAKENCIKLCISHYGTCLNGCKYKQDKDERWRCESGCRTGRLACENRC